MAKRVMIVTDEMIEEGRGFVSVNELLNFAISGTIVYFSLMRGVLAQKHAPPTVNRRQSHRFG